MTSNLRLVYIGPTDWIDLISRDHEEPINDDVADDLWLSLARDNTPSHALDW